MDAMLLPFCVRNQFVKQFPLGYTLLAQIEVASLTVAHLGKAHH